jgi:hypothetical protein
MRKMKKFLFGSSENLDLLEQLEFEQSVGWQGVSNTPDERSRVLIELIDVVTKVAAEEEEKRKEKEKIMLDKRWGRNG